MSSYDYAYSPLQKQPTRRPRSHWKIGCVALLIVDVVFLSVYLVVVPIRDRFDPLDRFQQL
jgi:hypothetical protein